MSTPRWITQAVLAALAQQGIRKAGDVFSARQLARWLTEAEVNAQQRTRVTSRLCLQGFLEHQHIVEEVDGAELAGVMYTLTETGAAQVAAVAAGQAHLSGPKAARDVPNVARDGTLAKRLWDLARIRRALDSGEAAQLLCDAGDPDAYRRTEATIRRTLRRWALAGAMAEAARRVQVEGQARTSNGRKRYVMQSDAVDPPRWWHETPDAKRRGQARGRQAAGGGAA